MASLREYRDKDGKLISYFIRVHKGRSADGTQLKPYTTTFNVEPTWSEKTARKRAEAFAANFEKECRDGVVSDSRQTFEEYGAYVLDLKESRGAIKRGTAVFYRNVAKIVNPIIGSLKVREVRPEHLNKMYTDFLKPNAETGKTLSAATVRGYHHYISMVFSQALKDGIISVSPASRAELPKETKKTPDYFQPGEILDILSALEKEPLKWRTILTLLIYTGCRRGEVLGLEWRDVDTKANKVHIRQAVLYRKETGIYIDTPKTASGDRWVAIPKSVSDLIEQYRKWQQEQIGNLDGNYVDNGLLFTQLLGQPMMPDTVTKYCKRFSERHNLPHIHPHSFRHSAASLLVYGGADLASVAHRLGHAQLSTTLDIYSHAITEADKQNADILSGVVKKAANARKKQQSCKKVGK